MTRNQKESLARITRDIDLTLKIRNSMIAHLDYCPSEATPILMENIGKAEKELRRLARIRRGIQRATA